MAMIIKFFLFYYIFLQALACKPVLPAEQTGSQTRGSNDANTTPQPTTDANSTPQPLAQSDATTPPQTDDGTPPQPAGSEPIPGRKFSTDWSLRSLIKSVNGDVSTDAALLPPFILASTELIADGDQSANLVLTFDCAGILDNGTCAGVPLEQYLGTVIKNPAPPYDPATLSNLTVSAKKITEMQGFSLTKFGFAVRFPFTKINLSLEEPINLLVTITSVERQAFRSYFLSSSSVASALDAASAPAIARPSAMRINAKPVAVLNIPIIASCPSGFTNMGTFCQPPPGYFDYSVDRPLDDKYLAQVLDWIQNETTGKRLPFCWRQSEGRGAGQVPGRVADCPATYTNNGATCGRSADTISAPSRLANCPSGYTNMGLTCFQPVSSHEKWPWDDCNDGSYTDYGVFCAKGGDTLGMSSMTCDAGYFQGADARCHYNDCPSGYKNTGETCFRDVSTLGMGSMKCNDDEVRSGARCYPSTGGQCGSTRDADAGLCYDKCKTGFRGVGPVCWQQCQAGWTSCAAGCGLTATDCALTVVGQVVSPLILAANIASLGLAAPETAAAAEAAKAGQTAATTIKVGSKVVSSNTKLGKAFITAVNAMQDLNPAKMTKGLKGKTYVQYIYKEAFFGGPKQKVIKLATLTKDVYGNVSDYATAYSEEFAKQTSDRVNSAIDANFTPTTALFVKKEWAARQLLQMAAVNGWTIAQETLSDISFVDITGITGVVSAYAHPVCQTPMLFPCQTKGSWNYPPGQPDTCWNLVKP